MPQQTLFRLGRSKCYGARHPDHPWSLSPEPAPILWEENLFSQCPFVLWPRHTVTHKHHPGLDIKLKNYVHTHKVFVMANRNLVSSTKQVHYKALMANTHGTGSISFNNRSTCCAQGLQENEFNIGHIIYRIILQYSLKKSNAEACRRSVHTLEKQRIPLRPWIPWQCAA